MVQNRESSKTSHVALWIGLVLLLQAGPAAAQVNAKAGMGMGLPYGSPLGGGGLELELVHHVAPLGGVGVGFDPPWAYGVRAYLQGPDRKFRFHGSALRWTEDHGFYFGVDHDVGKQGSFVVTYALGYRDVNLEYRVGMLLGFGYRF